MAYLELFDRVADHVRRQGVEATLTRGKPLTTSEIEEARAKTVICIPDAMAAFYIEVGDGMQFYWNAKGKRAPFANHEFPKLSDLMVESHDKLRWRTEWDDSYDFRFTKNPTLAKQTAVRMRKWTSFHDEGDGDEISLDTDLNPPPVVFNRHDWYDGGTGENGHRLANSLLQFYEDWSQVCFQFPSSLWWPSVFSKAGPGVDWNSVEFCEPFRLRDGL